jgi:hypothetical protein
MSELVFEEGFRKAGTGGMYGDGEEFNRMEMTPNQILELQDENKRLQKALINCESDFRWAIIATLLFGFSLGLMVKGFSL